MKSFNLARKLASRNYTDTQPAPIPKAHAGDKSWRKAFQELDKRRAEAGKLVLPSYGVHNIARRT